MTYELVLDNSKMLANCFEAPSCLVIDHVETYSDADVDGAREALSDGSDLTNVRLSSAAAADWFVYFEGPLTGPAIRLKARFNVISSDGPFVVRIRLWESLDALYEVRGTIEIPDGESNVEVVINDDFLASPPDGWDFIFDSGPSTVANFIDHLGSTPIVYFHGFDGLPYEVDVYEADLCNSQ